MSDTLRAPLDCEEVVREIWDWLDNELEPSRWSAIQEHLATCTGCSEHVAFARRFLERVRTAGGPTEDVEPLRERIRAALRAD